MFRIKRLLPLLFSLVLLFCSVLPVQAAEYEHYTVSGGDLVPQTDTGIMLLSEDYGIATVAELTHPITSGLKTITYWPSYTTSHEVLEIPLFKFKLSKDCPTWESYNYMRLYGNINIQNIVGMNPYLARAWVRNGGKKYELVMNYNWYSFTADECFNTDDCEFGIDIYFNTHFNSDSDRPLSEYSRPDLDEDNLTVAWEAFSYDLSFRNSIVGEKLDTTNSRLNTINSSINNMLGILGDKLDLVETAVNNLWECNFYWLQEIVINLQNVRADMNYALTNIFNRLEDVRISLWNQIEALRVSLWNKIEEFRINVCDRFETLFEKMDEDQEELINGYDPGTGSAAKNEFDSSAAELEAAEGDLFGQTSYDQVDYTQFNSFFSIEAVAASMLFVKSILESLYGALGVFGVPITIGLVLLVFTRIIGFQNFYSGGD